ncbi:uncharacterized protein LOC143048726 isoform X1 [Mytilus galloprovincialis]|uniref:uncharacterized protein LOC143048726 isoform X1 n=1 Tax=Mytilus galloprovincialis TaxID=29158 RepID=UPI003F7C70CA
MVECIVEFDYEAEQPDELSIKVGQILKNVLTEDGGWWEGELDGKKGMFPDNFVKIIEKKDKAVEKREKHEDPKRDIKTQQRTSVRDLASKIKDGIPVGASQRKKESHQAVIKRAKVLYSYEPDNEDELKLDIDDVVEVFKQEEEGWWEGSLHGKVGVFPSNFVQVIEEIEPTAKQDHIPEEKPKEPPQAEPKTKKIVGGVGLGNIFDGGPIKLRSATRSKVPPPEQETKPEEPSHHPTSVPKKDKQDRPPAEQATPLYTDQRSPSPFSDISGSFFHTVYDSETELDILPETIVSIQDLNMLQYSEILSKKSIVNSDVNVCVVDVHNSYLGETTSQLHPELESVLKISKLPEFPDEEEYLIEYADIEPDKGKRRNYPDVGSFKLTDFLSRSSLTNANSNNSKSLHETTVKDRTSSLHNNWTVPNIEPMKMSQIEVTKVKKKKSLLPKVSLNLFSKKTKSAKDTSVAFSNKISPIPSTTDTTDNKFSLIPSTSDMMDMEDKIKLEEELTTGHKGIEGYTVDDFTTKETQKYHTNDLQSKSTENIFSNLSVEDLAVIGEIDRERKCSHFRKVARVHQSAPNIKYHHSSQTDKPVDNKQVHEENYLATLNDCGHLSPFMKVIATKYKLFDIKDPSQKQSLGHRSVTLPRDLKLNNNSIDSEVDTVCDDNPFVSMLSGKFSPGRGESDQSSKKKKSPRSKSVSVAKKRSATGDSLGSPCNKVLLMTEREFINDYVDNVLDDVVEELKDEGLGKSKDTNDIFCHHKEEFDRIRAQFESGVVEEAVGGTSPISVPTLAMLCLDVLDDWEKRFIKQWKKKYDISSYTPPRQETSSYIDPDKYSNFSCPSTAATKSDVYEPYCDSRLSLTGDSLSETSFSRGIDSYSLDMSVNESYKWTGPWVSPAPTRRDLTVYPKQLLLKQGQNISTMSNCSNQSTQTASFDMSLSDSINISGNQRLVQTRNVSTSPIQELLMADLSMEENISNNSSDYCEGSPRVSSKPRYSSSPIANIPNLDLSSEKQDSDTLQEQVQFNGRKSDTIPRGKSYSSIQHSHNSSRVQRSRTLNYLSDLAQSLAETRKKRFAFKHLFLGHDQNPVKLLSFKKLSESVTRASKTKEPVKICDKSLDGVNKTCVGGKKTNKSLGTTRSPAKKLKQISNMKSCFPFEDFSTNDTYFNRILDEDKVESSYGSPPQIFDHFGKFKVSYENQQPHFDFQQVECKGRKFEFCSKYENLISCHGDKNCSAKTESFSNLEEHIDRQNEIQPSPRLYTTDKQTPEFVEPVQFLDNSTESEGPYLRIDKQGNYVLYEYPEDPVPTDDNLNHDFIKDNSQDLIEDELSPDSLSFMSSLTREIKQHDFTDTPKADDNCSNLNAFLQEALKPLDELLSDESSIEDLSDYHMSPTRWHCIPSDFPSFVSFRENEESFESDTNDDYPEPDEASMLFVTDEADNYPEPDYTSKYHTLKVEKSVSKENSIQEVLEDDRESCKAPDKSENLDDEQKDRHCKETLDDWLNYNQVVSEYMAPDRKERYPTFTFVTPHKTQQSEKGDNPVRMVESEERLWTNEQMETPCSTPGPHIYSTPGPYVYRSPEPNTCDNTFVSVSDMSFNDSRGCTPYFTDDPDTTLEDPVLANTNNNDLVTDDNNNISIEGSFNYVDLDHVLVTITEEDDTLEV